jgi:hypothetical protein
MLNIISFIKNKLGVSTELANSINILIKNGHYIIASDNNSLDFTSEDGNIMRITNGEDITIKEVRFIGQNRLDATYHFNKETHKFDGTYTLTNNNGKAIAIQNPYMIKIFNPKTVSLVEASGNDDLIKVIGADRIIKTMDKLTPEVLIPLAINELQTYTLKDKENHKKIVNQL